MSCVYCRYSPAQKQICQNTLLTFSSGIYCENKTNLNDCNKCNLKNYRLWLDTFEVSYIEKKEFLKKK